ncbi:MAG TPA: BON domain-containing protein [Gammaproteobacteria bacterium]|nr:BON domain-containing protein [Gammaproteobacteria bacterium]HRA42442.1 BON domain-containing protein [Gammaproteobacteria bacterium]
MTENRIFSKLLLLTLIAPLLQGCIAAAAGGAATGTVMVTDRRTAGTIMDDKTAEFKAIHAISLNRPLWQQSHITPISYNNVLLLVGQTPTEEFKRETEEAVSNIPKIRRIHNELTVAEPISLATRSHDSWVTTQIKAKLVGNKEISATRVKVLTEDNIVYLMGLLTHTEAEIATEIARAINGVEKVVQIFEYI